MKIAILFVLSLLMLHIPSNAMDHLKEYLRENDITFFKSKINEIKNREDKLLIEFALIEENGKTGKATFNIRRQEVTFRKTNRYGRPLSCEEPLYLTIAAFEQILQSIH